MEYLNGQDCSLLLTATGERVHAGPAWGPGDSALYSFLGPRPFAGRGAVLSHSEGHCPRELGGFSGKGLPSDSGEPCPVPVGPRESVHLWDPLVPAQERRRSLCPRNHREARWRETGRQGPSAWRQPHSPSSQPTPAAGPTLPFGLNAGTAASPWSLVCPLSCLANRHLPQHFRHGSASGLRSHCPSTSTSIPEGRGRGGARRLG